MSTEGVTTKPSTAGIAVNWLPEAFFAGPEWQLKRMAASAEKQTRLIDVFFIFFQILEKKSR
jgi:hypothetical protein